MSIETESFLKKWLINNNTIQISFTRQNRLIMFNLSTEEMVEVLLFNSYICVLFQTYSTNFILLDLTSIHAYF